MNHTRSEHHQLTNASEGNFKRGDGLPWVQPGIVGSTQAWYHKDQDLPMNVLAVRSWASLSSFLSPSFFIWKKRVRNN